MAMSALLLIALVAGASATSVEINEAETVTPVQKVVQLLDGLRKEVNDESKKQNDLYEKQACFCKDEKSRFDWLISMATGKSSQLAAKIEETQASVARFTSGIGEENQRITQLEADIEAEQEKRAKEHQEYLKSAEESDEAIKDIKDAIEALANSRDTQKGNVQKYVNFPQIKAKAQTALTAMQALVAEPTAEQVRAATNLAQLDQVPAGYAFASGDILRTLETLKDTSTTLKNDLDKAEFERKVASDKRIMALQKEKMIAESDRRNKQTALGDSEASLAEAQKAKAKEDSDASRYTESVNQLESDCQDIAAKYDEQQKASQDELAGLTSAEGLLKDQGLQAESAVSAALMQKKKPMLKQKPVQKKNKSFLEVVHEHENSQAKAVAEQKALEVISGASTRLKSTVLSVAVMKLRASGDNFVKVRGLIKDLISRLHEDSMSEANQKMFCDHEMKRSVDNRDKANAGMEDTNAQVVQKTAQMQMLTSDNAEKSKQVQEQTQAKADAAKLCLEDQQNIRARKAMAEIGRQSVAFAITTLNQVFNNQGTALVQTARTVTKMKNNIVANLETIQADFERTKGECDDELEESQKQCETMDHDLAEDIDSLKSSQEDQASTIKSLEADITDLQDNMGDFKELKERSAQELEKLKSMCVSAAETYEQRAAKAKQEIEALNEAMAILDATEQ